MAMQTAERRAVVRAQLMGPTLEQQDPLPCPRCTSNNTKFCYYNNYNFSQPRHFCKACRRYWTHGGTLRDIPVGGGSRKNAKRSRTANHHNANAAGAATANTNTNTISTQQQAPVLVSMPLSGGGGGGFTSLLNGGGILSLGGLGFGLGLGFDEVGYGLAARGVWAFPPPPPPHHVGLHVSGGCGETDTESRSDTWQVESGGVVGLVDGDACFTAIATPVPELAASMSDNGLK